MLTDDTAVQHPEPDRAAEARAIQARYGVPAWFGYWTRRWGALVDRRTLVEGAGPDRLGEAILAARRTDARRWAP